MTEHDELLLKMVGIVTLLMIVGVFLFKEFIHEKRNN